jgi:hypothetical protein
MLYLLARPFLAAKRTLRQQGNTSKKEGVPPYYARCLGSFVSSVLIMIELRDVELIESRQLEMREAA